MGPVHPKIKLRDVAINHTSPLKGMLVSLTYSVAFRGAEACPVEVQCSLSPGLPGFRLLYPIKQPNILSSKGYWLIPAQNHCQRRKMKNLEISGDLLENLQIHSVDEYAAKKFREHQEVGK